VEKPEEADKNKGLARSSKQKCKFYKTFNKIIFVLENETKSSPRSARRCYMCTGPDCRDPYPGRPEHERNCEPWYDHCVKVAVFTGKWLHNRHLNIYIRQSQNFSKYIKKFCN
jgi:hypothetical protein